MPQCCKYGTETHKGAHIQAIKTAAAATDTSHNYDGAAGVSDWCPYRQLETMNLNLVLLADFVADQKGRHVLALVPLQLNDLQ